MKMTFFIFLMMTIFASDESENSAEKSGKTNEETDAGNLNVVKIEEGEYVKKKRLSTSEFIGVFRDESRSSKWRVCRWSRYENTNVANGCYDDEETAAHASDTLARKLMQNGEQNLKLNFPYDYTEVFAEEKKRTSKYIGVTYYKSNSKWYTERWSKNRKKLVHNGCYGDEETAAHASDTLARKLMKNGENCHKLNFPDDDTEVHKRKSLSKYFGVTSKYGIMKWYAQRHSKKENKMIFNGSYDNEETAAHASDTLARKLMSNGNRNLRLNFPDDDTEVWSKARITSEYQHKIEYENKKRKKPKNLENSEDGINYQIGM